MQNARHTIRAPFPPACTIRFWTHRSWKVRHGVLQTVAEAVASAIPGVLAHKEQTNNIITQVVNLVEDPDE